MTDNNAGQGAESWFDRETRREAAIANALKQERRAMTLSLATCIA
jgi:hypothetical protein